MIGINAPELSDIFGIEAKEHLKHLIEYKTVTLTRDQISNESDRYQRLLRYVYYEGVDINKKMIDDGFAFAYLKYKFSKSKEYESAQKKSKENFNGIWANDSNKKTKIKKDKKIDFNELNPKTYLMMALLFTLAIIGFIYYFKK
jgi:micrococcal nuclease